RKAHRHASRCKLKRNGPPLGGPFGIAEASDGTNVGGLLALRPFDDVELHGLAFGQCSIAVSSDRAVVDEDVIAIRAGDEAVPLLVAEPLHGSLAQPVPPYTTPIRHPLGGGASVACGRTPEQ